MCPIRRRGEGAARETAPCRGDRSPRVLLEFGRWSTKDAEVAAKMEWTQESLAEHFYRQAEARANADGRHFGEGADNDLRALVNAGARRLLATVEAVDIAAAVDRASADIVRLIDLAIEGAQSLPDYDRNLLGERSYFPARFRFCPCDPFC